MRVGALVLGGCLLTGCTAAEDGSPPRRKAGPVARPAANLSHVVPVRWDGIDLGSDHQTIQVRFRAGGSLCTALAGIETTELPDRVVVTVRVGRPRATRLIQDERAMLACLRDGRAMVAEAVLEQPLGTRRFIDGAVGAVRCRYLGRSEPFHFGGREFLLSDDLRAPWELTYSKDNDGSSYGYLCSSR